jgi:hypothetical protein
LVLAIHLGKYDRFILSGFSFGDSHAYEEKDRKGKYDKHFETDVAVVNCLCAIWKNIYTSEEGLSRITNVPML